MVHTTSHKTSSNRSSRHEEIIISRLRIGHTRLTHSYLLLGLYSPPSCQYCHTEEITVPHFLSCPSFQNLKESFLVPSLLSWALSNSSETITNTLNLLRKKRKKTMSRTVPQNVYKFIFCALIACIIIYYFIYSCTIYHFNYIS